MLVALPLTLKVKQYHEGYAARNSQRIALLTQLKRDGGAGEQLSAHAGTAVTAVAGDRHTGASVAAVPNPPIAAVKLPTMDERELKTNAAQPTKYLTYNPFYGQMNNQKICAQYARHHTKLPCRIHPSICECVS